MRPPRVDVAPHVVECFVLGIEMERHRAAAAGVRRAYQRDAETIEHAGGGGVGCRRETGLHAAFEHQHPARVTALRPGFCGCRRGRHFAFQCGRQKRTREPAQREQGLEYHGIRNDGAQGLALQRFGAAAADAVLDDLTPDIEQPAVMHARGAGGFAGAAGQAAVEMKPGFRRGRHAFQDLLHQVDAAARPVELVAEQLVSRAGRGAETAVHALAQDGVGFAPLWRVFDEVGEISLHSKPI